MAPPRGPPSSSPLATAILLLMQRKPLGRRGHATVGGKPGNPTIDYGNGEKRRLLADAVRSVEVDRIAELYANPDAILIRINLLRR